MLFYFYILSKYDEISDTNLLVRLLGSVKYEAGSENADINHYT
jgi:hypothetical protein